MGLKLPPRSKRDNTSPIYLTSLKNRYLVLRRWHLKLEPFGPRRKGPVTVTCSCPGAPLDYKYESCTWLKQHQKSPWFGIANSALAKYCSAFIREYPQKCFLLGIVRISSQERHFAKTLFRGTICKKSCPRQKFAKSTTISKKNHWEDKCRFRVVQLVSLPFTARQASLRTVCWPRAHWGLLPSFRQLPQ